MQSSLAARWLNKASALAGCYCGNDRCFFTVQYLEFKVQQANAGTSVYTATEEARTPWFNRRAHHPALEATAAIKSRNIFTSVIAGVFSTVRIKDVCGLNLMETFADLFANFYLPSGAE